MRYPASEKLEIIRLVEQSHLSVRRTLAQIRIPRSTFYRWCDQYQTGGPEALDDRSPRPDRGWNRIPDDVPARVVTLALDQPELSPRELAVRFTDVERYFVSEASVYRLLKAHDLITSPAFIAMKAADEFKNKTTAPNQLWQTDFTYLKVTGWGWFYLSTILDDFSRYIIAWKLRSMRSSRTTTTGAITRVSIISPRPTSTSGEAKPSCWKEKGSNAKPSKTVACFTTNKPHNINQDAPDPLLDQAASCLKISDDGQYATSQQCRSMRCVAYWTSGFSL